MAGASREDAESGPMVVCPKDPANRYYRRICLSVFQKGDIRPWCKICRVLEAEPDADESA